MPKRNEAVFTLHTLVIGSTYHKESINEKAFIDMNIKGKFKISVGLFGAFKVAY